MEEKCSHLTVITLPRATTAMPIMVNKCLTTEAIDTEVVLMEACKHQTIMEREETKPLIMEAMEELTWVNRPQYMDMVEPIEASKHLFTDMEAQIEVNRLLIIMETWGCKHQTMVRMLLMVIWVNKHLSMARAWHMVIKACNTPTKALSAQ
jgi:hypothetical protein